MWCNDKKYVSVKRLLSILKGVVLWVYIRVAGCDSCEISWYTNSNWIAKLLKTLVSDWLDIILCLYPKTTSSFQSKENNV